MRVYAQNHGANGVIDISTRFHSTETHSASEFTCATSASAATLKLTGEAVTFESK